MMKGKIRQRNVGQASCLSGERASASMETALLASLVADRLEARPAL
jgi:hypothetical protein